MIKLPEPVFFSLPQLAKRWGCDESEIQHLIETDFLPVSDKYAALQGKRRTVFRAAEPVIPPDMVEFFKAIKTEAIKHFREAPPKDDEAVVLVDIPNSAAARDEDWNSYIQAAIDAYPDASVPVVIAQDVLAFEARAESQTPAGLSKRESQFKIISTVINSFGFEPMKIPTGGKSKILAECLDKHLGLFTPAAFEHAWKSGLNAGLFRLANHEKYSNK